MDDDSRVPPLTQRAPGESGMRRPGEEYTRVVLPESVVQRVRAALENCLEQEQIAFRESPDFQKIAPLQEALELPEPRDLPESAAVPEAPELPEPRDLPESAAAQEAPDMQEAPNVQEPGALPASDNVPEAPKVPEAAASQEALEPSAQGTRHTTPPSSWFPVNPDDDTAWFAAISIPESASGAAPAPRRSAGAVPDTRASVAGSSQATTRAPTAESAPAAAPRVSAGRRYRMAGVLLSVVILVATGSIVFALSRHGASGSRTPAPSSQTARNSAASWVASEVSAGAVVACDPVMCQALRAHGIPSGRLLALRSSRTDPLRSKVIVATADVRSEFGRRLAAVYAPAVIARFGSGSLRIDIRATAQQGAAAYLSDLSADALTRKSSGSELVRSQLITTSAAARAQLIEGKVDWRLLYTIANLATMHRVSILAFSDSGPGASPGMPLRAADLAEAASRAGTADPAYVRSMVKILHAQGSPYVPAHIQTVRLAGGRAALRIEFAAPSPVDMLTPLAPDLP
jgi:hypothetical protein